EWGRSHPRHTDAFAPQIFDGPNTALYPRLHAQTAAMDSGRELHIQSLFNRFEEIHDQMMRHVVPAERQDILVILPITFHQRDVQPLFFEKSLLDRSEYRRFAGDADITDTDFIRLIDGGIRGLVTSVQQQST